jgi:dihydroorotate dehydrogenase (fumarate)/dihydropyrimidine dehydrogenase (NAD+) subunit PreA
MADITVDFCGLKLKNPLIVASIEPSNSVENIKKCIDYGAAAVITKTIGDLPGMAKLTQHSKYAILNDKGQLIKGKIPRHFVFYSRSGYVTEPWEDWVGILEETQAYADEHGAYIIANIASGTMKGWCDLARMVEDCGIKMIEVNYQCPHPAELIEGAEGAWIAQDPAVTAEVTRQIVAAVDIPVMVKLSPESNRITEIARAAMEAGAASIAVNSRFVGFAVDIEKGEPYIDGPAGVGGPWVKYVTLRWINEIFSFDWRDAVEFIMSGAQVMQVGSVLMLKGIEWLPKITEGIERFLDEHGYPDVKSIHGLASKKALSTPAEFFAAKPVHCVVDHDKCKFPTCTVCIRMCFYDSLHAGDDQVLTTPEQCIGCELCQNVCGFDAITMVEKDEAAVATQSAA